LKSVALPVPGSGGRRGSETVPFERALVSSYRPSIVTYFSSIVMRFRDIAAAFVLQNDSFFPPHL